MSGKFEQNKQIWVKNNFSSTTKEKKELCKTQTK